MKVGYPVFRAMGPMPETVIPIRKRIGVTTEVGDAFLHVIIDAAATAGQEVAVFVMNEYGCGQASGFSGKGGRPRDPVVCGIIAIAQDRAG